jgi:serine/threonine-protein kinase
MFTLFSGRFVHEAETANEALVAAVTQRAPLVATVVPELHPAVTAIVDRALAYERELRFQSASEFREAVRAADGVIAEDEASPSLRVPKSTPTPVVQSGPLGLTTEGIATSVRAARTNPATTIKRRSKTPLVVAGVAAVALFGLVGRGLLGGAGKPAAFPSEAKANAAEVALAAPPAPAAHGAPVAAVSATANIASVATTAALAAPTPTPPNKIAHAPSRNVSAASHPGATPKPHAEKTAADLLKKRH